MMSLTNEEDPFLQVQQDVLSQLQSTRPLFASYLRIRSLSTTTISPELSSVRADLESALASLSEDLADLTESVKAVESDPVQYGVSMSELKRRQRLVKEVGGEIEDMREELSKKVDSSAAARAARQAANNELPDPNAFAIGDGDEGDNYTEFEHRQQTLMMRDQDETLDGVAMTVGNLRRQADDMGRELEEQREMLEVVDNAADRVGSRLATGVAKLNHIVRQNEDRWSGCCIGVLIMVLIILLVLLLIL
ncbi:SNARE domain-containing protein [Pseudomassariella vexata]|uniref:t-SNARE affecting a late Golgi compartment protein 1 n=1 Tax=Pseudomassariella vexata TaxID=1141098 RepID=A0A1Y2EK62_9PEZI|nr:SNARE domain-containing protein [Pseudomassariella vexata]ORY71215.1 SNARE domain-containing protein [Pseudomassariella vexata]